MNNKQQLLALQADFGALPVSEVIGILQFLQEKEIFSKLTGISVLIRVPDPVLVPADIDTRLPLARVLFSVPSRSADDKDRQSRLKYFSSHGARIVIDDIEINAIWEGASKISADCIKGIPAHVKPLMMRLQGGNHIAQNLPNSALLAQADEAGFKWFSGDYAFNPPIHNKAADATARTRLLKLLGLVARDAESRELEELFKQDATLSFMLFKLVSSAAFAQTVRVSSFGQAINLLGRRQLQRWLQLLLYARQQDHHGGLNPLMPRAAFRASLMEAICLKRGGSKDELDCAFMVGMFSLLDKLFGNPLIEVLQPLNLNSEVLSALLQKTGALGKSLDLVEKADRPYKDFTPGVIEELGLSADDYYECVITAYAWVNQVCQDM